ncbi:MAG: sigma-54 dependent transcriptional regulator, partial [Fibrobacterota bacterium]
VEAMKNGAADYITKPFAADEIVRILEKTESVLDAQDEPRLLSAAGGRPMVGQSRLMEELRAIIERVGPSDATVLIQGESGTGKELVARAIHARSTRNGQSFVAVNCAALAESVLESELFGHEKGAFTGATAVRAGRFELADKGTLFLDEIGEISPAVQVKLLRVLQERTFERVGGVREIRADFRLITATNRDLQAEVRQGRFREDLFYRLNIIPLSLPPLRERKEDIPTLLRHFIESVRARTRSTIRSVTPSAMERLLRYGWPGNIRELENFVERALVLACGEEIDLADLPPHLMEESSRPSVTSASDLKSSLRASRSDVEKGHIITALKEEKSNRTNAAKRLGISRKSLQLKIREYGLENL